MIDYSIQRYVTGGDDVFHVPTDNGIVPTAYLICAGHGKQHVWDIPLSVDRLTEDVEARERERFGDYLASLESDVPTQGVAQ